MSLFGRSLLCSQDWSVEELFEILNFARYLKKERFRDFFLKDLSKRAFGMLFFNSSLRTRISFELAIAELGGTPLFLTPEMTWLSSQEKIGESVIDAARVMSRYLSALGIRILLDEIPYYGAGHNLLREYEKWSDIPIISMADDRFHPCQGLADLMGWSEYFITKDNDNYIDNLRGKTVLITWASSPLIRPWSSVQSHLLLASRFGMNVTLARPNGYDLDPAVYEMTKNNCLKNQRQFNIISNPNDGYDGADVVFVRNWISSEAYQKDGLRKETEMSEALERKDWFTTQEKMQRTNNGIFANPMPVMRGFEVEDNVVDSDKSVIYDVAENRLHVQKSILAYTMENNQKIKFCKGEGVGEYF